MHIKNKKMYVLLMTAAVLFISLFLLAKANVDTNDAWHPVQQIAISDGSTTSIDNDGDGVVDSTDACNSDGTCEMSSASVSNNLNVGGDGSFSGDVSANAFYYSSDRNLKENIYPVQKPLEKLDSVRGVHFTWKKSNRESIGLIAQDVEQEFPELVKTDSKSGMKSVQYGNMVGVLVEAVKEQQKEIDELKEEIKELKKER